MNQNGDATTLELDAETVHILVDLAKTWGVSEGEAVRRAVELANPVTDSSTKVDRLEALKELQRSLSLTPAKVAEWQKRIREARR
jgi:hypothetical protein